VFFDQRGSGRSTPRGSVQANTSADLLADIERLRAHLRIERWVVAGGSWGAGLAIAYAAAHPDRCLGLVLRAPFLGRSEDTDGFFTADRTYSPAGWGALQRFTDAGESEISGRALLLALHRVLHGADQTRALDCANAWQSWEQAVSNAHLMRAQRLQEPGAALDAPVDRQVAAARLDKYRVQSHYLVNDCFWGEHGLLERAKALGRMPISVIHGELDAVCLPEASQALLRAAPHCELHWVAGCGHDLFAPAMVQAFRDALWAMHARLAAALPAAGPAADRGKDGKEGCEAKKGDEAKEGNEAEEGNEAKEGKGDEPAA
jgi:proline iminopeptidase